MYECKICNYCTDRYTDLKRHFETKKHIKTEYVNSLENTKCVNKMRSQKKCNDVVNDISNDILETLSNDNTNNEVENIEDFNCVCGKKFNCRKNFWRHKQSCKDILHSCVIEEKDKTIDMLKQQIEFLQGQLKNTEKVPKKKDVNNVINSTNNINETTINCNNKTINVITYINENYPNVRPITMLTNIAARKMLKFDDTHGHSLEDMIVFQYSKFLLDQFIGDFIVSEYKKTDPNKQQIWSSNVQKLNFIVRQILNKTDKVWLKDFNGVCVIRHIIDPILKEILKMLKVYVKNCSKSMENSNISIDEFDKYNDKLCTAVKVIYDINQKQLHNQILRYIAPYFQLTGIIGAIEDLD